MANFKKLTLDAIDAKTQNLTPALSISQYEYEKQYSTTDARNKLDVVLAQVDKRDTLEAAFSQATDGSWQNYAPELFMQQILHTEIKRPDYAQIVCPNSITATRDKAVWLGLTEDESKAKKPSWKFLGETERVSNAMHTYERKETGLRRYGTGWCLSREALSDIPLDLVAHRQLIAQAQYMVFREKMLTSSLYEMTSGTFATTYSNRYECAGTQTTKLDGSGATVTRTHGISVEDIFDALSVFSSDITPAEEPRGKLTKGDNYYQASCLVLPPAAIRNLALELFRTSYLTRGPQAERQQVVDTARLSDVFGIPVVPLNCVKWADGKNRSQNSWEWISDGYIVDSSWVVETAHSDGWLLQNWFDEDTRQFLWSQTRRSNYVVTDPLGVLRLEAYTA